MAALLLALAAWLSACDGSPASLGEASLEDIINTVELGPEGGPFETARNGASVDIGIQVKSGDNSLARLAFSAGPVARLSPNTSLAMQAPVAPEEVRLRLEAGRLRLSLFGHRFGVATPLGLIQVDGFGDVAYHVGASPEAGDDALAFRCLAGPCLFQSDAASLALQNLEALTVVDGGLIMTRTLLVDLDLRQFIADNPGSIGLLATLTAAPTRTAPPTPTSTRTATPRPASPVPDTPTGGPPTGSATSPPSATSTATRTRAPIVPPRATATPTPTDTPVDTPTPTDTPFTGGGGDLPTNPPPTSPPPTNPPPPTDTPVPPPTDTPPPPPPPSKTPGG